MCWEDYAENFLGFVQFASVFFLQKDFEIDSYVRTVGQNDCEKINRAKAQGDAPCHFDRREKSFLDPSRTLWRF